MDLAMASVFFDDDPLYDGYTGEYLYDGQFATYDGSQLDGSFIRRRTVSLGPSYALPARRVISLYGERWVLSDSIKDGFKSDTVRQTLSARKVHGLYSLLTPAEFARQELPTRQAYGFARMIKGTQEASTSALTPYYEFSFSETEEPLGARFIQLGERVWHPRMEGVSAEGFREVEADLVVGELGYTASAVTVVAEGVVDPVSLLPSPGAAFPAMILSRSLMFTKTDQAQQNNYHGDKTLIVAKADLPETQGNLTLDGEDWAISGTEDLGDGFALHVQRV